jgi:excisionase family DNA binding protein
MARQRQSPTATVQLVAPRNAAGGRTNLDVTVRADNRVALTVEEAAERLGIGRTLMYQLLASGEVRSLRVGRLRRVPVDALIEYIERLAPTPPDAA